MHNLKLQTWCYFVILIFFFGIPKAFSFSIGTCHFLRYDHNFIQEKRKHLSLPSIPSLLYEKKRSKSGGHVDAFMQLSMALIPAPVPTLTQALVLGVPTGEQWSAYWGRTPRERYDALFEAVSTTFLGLFGSYFLGFVVGTPIATLTGTVALFWVLLGPEFKAYQRNWELRAGRDLVDIFEDDDYEYDEYNEDQNNRGLYGAYFLSSVAHVAVVNTADTPASREYPLSEFQDYTMENDEQERISGIPYKLRLRIEDINGRTLQVHARMSEEYLDIQKGMPVASILLSTKADFGQLAALTDIWIPEIDAWVGDYPYLNKEVFRSILGQKKMRTLLENESWIDEEDEYLDEYYDEEKYEQSP